MHVFHRGQKTFVGVGFLFPPWGPGLFQMGRLGGKHLYLTGCSVLLSVALLALGVRAMTLCSVECSDWLFPGLQPAAVVRLISCKLFQCVPGEN